MSPGPSRLIPIAREGFGPILVPFAVALALAGLGWPAAAAPFAALGAFMAFFFRDPERVVPDAPGAILAPADGRVVDVQARVEDGFVGVGQRVSIFLSPLDVHVNRAPVSGLVVAVERRPGAFRAAYRPDASERNERVSVAIQAEAMRVVVRQIAGVLARRIVCRVQAGDKLAAGARFGMIKFGSRTDVVVPAGVRLSVRQGDRVRAGETILGVLP
jgi:phosphatidylserine decarboxylase